MRRLALASLVLTGACLEPRVSDEVVGPSAILPAGAQVPSLYANAAEAAQIGANQGVGKLVPLLSGFVDGEPVRFWNLGPAPAFAQPLYVLAQDGVPLDQPTVITRLPGDPGYSPFWAVYLVAVTTRYNGEQLTSPRAIQEAVERGLVAKPELQDFQVNCPVVLPDTRLEVGEGLDPVPPGGRFYYEGQLGTYFDFGASPLVNGIEVPAADLLVLRREGGELLSEPVRGVDMTGDGDTRDTNDIFVAARGAAGYTPLVRLVEVTIPAATDSIDTTGDQTKADVTAASQLFSSEVTHVPIVGRVVAFQITETLMNAPQQAASP